MSVLITGGAGYIGSHTVWELLDVGANVVVIDDLSTGFGWAIPPEATLVRGDVGDQRLVRRIIHEHGISSIVHFAGSVVVPDSVADPLRYYMNNTVKSRSLIEAAVASGVSRFVFSSTAAVYGIEHQGPVEEASPTTPISPYGRSKLMTEMMLEDTAAAHDFRFVTLRYFNVAGADHNGRTGQSTRGATHLIKVAAEVALGKRKAIEIFGTDYPTPDGTGVRDYIHVTDLARAHLAALNYLEATDDSIVANCGYGHGYSVLQIIDAVERLSGKRLDIVRSQRRPGDPASLVADSSLLRQTLSWNPEYDDLDAIIRSALSWEEALSRRNQK